MKRFSEELNKGWAHVSYHLVVVALSAAFAWSLPFTARISEVLVIHRNDKPLLSL
jgi:hypothetical protein